MRWEDLGYLGHYLELRSGKEARGTRRASDFLRSTIHEFASKSVAFRQVTGMMPFSYRERATDSVLLPAATHNADAVLSQQPISRRRHRGHQFGFLDYLIFHRGVMILMEVKHSWFNLRTGRPTRGLRDRWEEAVDQVDRVDVGEIRHEYGSYGNRAFRIAMMVSPFWKGESDGHFENSKVDRDELPDLLNSIADRLRPTPNWCGIWSIPRPFQVTDYSEGRDKHFEYYPAVAFICHIHVRAG